MEKPFRPAGLDWWMGIPGFQGIINMSIPAGDRDIQVYCEALTGVSASGKVYVQASPNSNGSLWANVSLEITSPASPGMSASGVIEFVAKRIRLISSLVRFLIHLGKRLPHHLFFLQKKLLLQSKKN
jgi:hypothetical protein